MIVLLIFGFVIFVFYNVVAIIKNKNVPESLSETSYIWESTCKHKQLCQAYWFSFLCFFIVLILFLPWLSASAVNLQFIPFIGLLGLTLCGCTPFFKAGNAQTYIHYISGIIAILCWAIWIILSAYYTILIIFCILYSISLILNDKNFIYWAEILSISLTFILLIIFFY